MVTQRRSARGAAPYVVLGLVVLASSVLLLSYASGLTFFQDSWAFLMHRQGFTADAFLEPHNEHIVLVAVALQKVLLEIFGMSSAAPEFVLMTALLGLTAVLLFIYVRRRVGAWPAVFAATLLLFVGPAWQVLLWPFEIVFVGSLMSGIAMLLMLERGDGRGDAAACALLVLSLGFSTLGLSFALAAIVDVALGLRERGWRRGLRRAYVFVVPLALFGAWYLGWGRDAENHVTAHNITESPIFLAEGMAAALANLLGISTVSVTGVGSPDWGWALLGLGVLLAAWALLRGHRFSSRVLPSAVAAASFWMLAGANYIPGREAVVSRYAYSGAVFALLLAADLLKGVRFGRAALWVAAAVTAAAAIANLQPLREGNEIFREQAILTKADIGAMEVARRTVAPNFELTPEVAGTPSLIDVFADEYFPVAREYGSPAYSPEALVTAPALGRRQADLVLAQALPISFTVRLDTALAPGAGPCVTVPAGSGSPVRIGPGVTEIALAPGPHAGFSLRRFASGEFPVSTDGAPGGSVSALKIPADRSSRPWVLRVEARQPARVCR